MCLGDESLAVVEADVLCGVAEPEQPPVVEGACAVQCKRVEGYPATTDTGAVSRDRTAPVVEEAVPVATHHYSSTARSAMQHRDIE